MKKIILSFILIISAILPSFGLSSDALIINEIMPSNIDMFMSPATNFDGWIEFYNPKKVNITLKGMWISDDKDNLLKWKFPEEMGVISGYGYKLLWFGHPLLNAQAAPFTLDCDGGTLYLSNQQGTLVHTVTYPAVHHRASYARTTDGGDTWGWTSEPTPLASNATTVYASQELETPEIVADNMFITSGGKEITINFPSDTELKYTLDGTTPTRTNGITSNGKVLVKSSTILRCRVFKEGFLPSQVCSRAFVVQKDTYTLPILCVNSERDFLYDDSIGITVQGVNGVSGKGTSYPANWNMDWERPATMQLATADGEILYNKEFGLTVSGRATRSYNQSLKAKAYKRYDGNKYLDYPFFDIKPYNKLRSILIRTGGNDNTSRIVDAAVQTIAQQSGIDIDLQAYLPVVFFLNGSFKGVRNLREPNNKDFALSNFGYEEEELDFYEMDPSNKNEVMLLGDWEKFELIEELAKSANNEESYKEIKKYLDVDEFINYLAHRIYLGNDDWPQNNFKGYRHRPDGRFRFIDMDEDLAFDANDVFLNFFYPHYGNSTSYYKLRIVNMFTNLLKNDSFRKKFIDTMCMMPGTVFLPSVANPILNKLADRVRDMLALENKNVDTKINKIKNGIANRVNIIPDALKNESRMRLSDTKRTRIKLGCSSTGGRILVDSIPLPNNLFDGYLYYPITLRAEALAGYRFTGWRRTGSAEIHTLIKKGDVWNYYDQGSLDGTGWNGTNNSTISWKSGTAPLGYGMSAITMATTLNYGSDADNKRPTYYFRKEVELPTSLPTNSSFKISMWVDDGCVIYVNGKEAIRHNMPTGTIQYSTFAPTYPTAIEAIEATLDASLFKGGTNVIAVEVHNQRASSTDILWDAQLSCSYTPTASTTTYYSTEKEITLPEAETINLTACFATMSTSQRKELGINSIRINEVSPANNIYINEYRKKSDWIELYNASSTNMDLEGMYLTDDLSNPQKYKITKGTTNATTILPAHQHTIIWCSDLETEEQLHAPFKLAASGGSVMLSSKDMSWSDTLTYQTVAGYQTVGRYPDGSNNVYLMNVPTINKENIFTSYLQPVSQKIPDGITSPELASESPLKLHYRQQELLVQGEPGSTIQLYIYDMQGQLLHSESIHLSGTHVTVALPQFRNGIYLSKISDNKGHSSVCKFLLQP